MFKFEMRGCRIECEDLGVFQKLLSVIMTHCDEKLAPPQLVTMTGYRGELENQKIAQIKLVREITGLNLADAKYWVEGKSMLLSRIMINQLIGAGFQVRQS